MDREKRAVNYIVNFKHLNLLFAGIIVYYFFRITDWFFHTDDILLLHQVISEPFLELLTPAHHFLHYRPLSQYGFFKLCYLLFGINPLGYYLFNLSLLLLNLWVIEKIFTSLGIEKISTRLVCLMILASPSFFQNLIWISNAQHIIPFLFILLMIYCEILWNQNKKRRYKVLALFAFVLGLFSNFTSFIAIPLVCLVHLFFLRPEENRFQIGYYLRILFALSPYLILLAAFYWFYSGTVAYKNYQMLVQDETHPYYAIFTVAQAFRNLEKIVKYIFPARGLILLLVPLIMIFSIVVFVKNFLTKKKQNNQVKMNIFFILWFLISIFMFLFFKGRRPENLFFLGSIGIYFLLITNVIGFILQRGMSEKNKKICINIILIFILGTHCFYSYKRGSPENHNIRIGGFGGQKNEKAIRQIRYLVDFYLEGKKVIYLVSYERYVSKAEDFVDHTLIFLGYGTFAKVFFKDMNIVFEFVLENIEERIRGIKEDEALIFYDGNCNFFLRPLPALDS